MTGSNLVVRDGHLAGVLDFGCCAVGDPACDLTIAWMVNHAVAPTRPNGLEGTREWLSTEGKKFLSFRSQHLTVVAEDDLVVQFGVRGGTWPGAPFRGFDVPAGAYARDTAFMYRLAEGRIVERWAVNDHLAMLLQLGAIPAPASAP